MARYITRLACFFLQILASLSSQSAEAENPIDFMTSNCELFAADPSNGTWPKLCLRAATEVDLALESQNQQKSRNLGVFGYLGTHFSKTLSLHVRGGELMRLLDNVSAKRRNQPSRLFMQVGNPASDSLSVLIGKIDAPFGLHKIWLPAFYRDQYQSEAHWRTAPYGMRLSAGASHSTSFEIGLTREWSTHYTRDEERQYYATALRIFHDITAVGQTRLVASALATTDGERRVGAAMLIQTNEKSEFALEWVRTYLIEGKQLNVHRQLAKISLEFPNEKNNSYFFGYEDESGSHWLTTLGYKYSIMRNLLINGIVSFHGSKSEDTSNYFIFSLGSKAWL